MEWRKINLTKEQEEEIRNAESQIKTPQLIRRLHCIKLKHKGWKHAEVAEFLNVTIVTVSDWIKVYCEEGLQSLLNWDCKGRVSVLTIEDQEKLKARQEEKPFDTAKEVKQYIKEELGRDFHLHWVQKLLKKNFNCHTKSPD